MNWAAARRAWERARAGDDAALSECWSALQVSRKGSDDRRAELDALRIALLDLRPKARGRGLWPAIAGGAIVWLCTFGALALSGWRSERGWWAQYKGAQYQGAQAVDLYGPYHDWASGSPRAELDADDFAVRWEACWSLPSRRSPTLELTADDGARVYIDGRLLLDSWNSRGVSTTTAALELDEGTHRVTVDYVERGGGALVELTSAGRPLDVDELTPVRPRERCRGQ